MTQKLVGGNYNRAVIESDFTINLSEDTQEQIINKVKSEVGFRGAVIRVGNLKLYVTDYEKIK